MVERRIVFYLIAAYIFFKAKNAHTLITDQLIQAGHRVSHAGQNKFLTVIGMKINFYYMLTAILITFGTPRNSKSRRIFSWYWASIVFPVACVVCGMYWGLVAVDPELVGPEHKRKYFEGLPDHLLHTFPIIIQLIEAMFVKHERVSKKKDVSGKFGFFGGLPGLQ